MPADNKGNLITRRAFADTDRMQVLRRVVNKAMSTAYQMTEEVGEYGSGTPSPLHMHCELIREAYELDTREGAEVSTAQELAEYPLAFLRQLRGESATGGDFVCKVNCMLKAGAQANYIVRGRDLRGMTPGELREFSQQLMTVSTLAGELIHMADEAERAIQFPGAPIQAERQFRRTGTDN